MMSEAGDMSDESPAAWLDRFYGGILRWGVICFVSSISSWCWVAQLEIADSFPAVFAGILCFVLAYAFIGAHPRVHRWSQRTDIRLTLRIGYLTRMAISVIFPVGMAVDVYPGLLASVFVTETLGISDAETFLPVFLTTIVQGILLNVMLILFMALVFPIVRIWRRPEWVNPMLCTTCAYDLTGNQSGKCPECGMMIAPAKAASS